MKITRLHKAHDYRIFQDFTWPSSLLDFATFNVIYGWNGSGKTSLSNLFRHIQRRQPLTDGQVETLVGQTRVAGADFATAALPSVRVFNRDAVDRNVFEQANQQFPPVFFLGEDSVEKQRQIEGLSKQLAAITKDASDWERKKADANSALETFCSEKAKGVKNLLTVAGGGGSGTVPRSWRKRFLGRQSAPNRPFNCANAFGRSGRSPGPQLIFIMASQPLEPAIHDAKRRVALPGR